MGDQEVIFCTRLRAVMVAPSLYRRLLGSRFELLPGVLRRFHDADGGGRALGTFQVERGRGLLRNALASLMGFPKAGIDVPVTLKVSIEGDRERWSRRFGDMSVESKQWEKDHLLIEEYGMNSFSSSVAVVGSDVIYEFQRAWLVGIPLPSWLSPRIDGLVTGEETGWRVVVRVFAPVLGEILHYEGWVQPE
jgi:Domain of unknown function (DUF4166)